MTKEERTRRGLYNPTPWRYVAALSIAATLGTSAIVATPALAEDLTTPPITAPAQEGVPEAAGAESPAATGEEVAEAAGEVPVEMNAAPDETVVDEQASDVGTADTPQVIPVPAVTDSEPEAQLVANEVDAEPTVTTSATPEAAANAAPLAAPAPANQGTVLVGEGQAFQSLRDAIGHVSEGTIRVVSDLEDTDAADIVITSGQHVTIESGDQPAGITFRGGRIVVDGGSLTLGGDDATGTISLVDRRDGYRTAPLVEVLAGTLTLRDGAAIVGAEASAGTSVSGQCTAVRIGEGAGSEVARLYGEGGSVAGGRVRVGAHGEGSITGGSYAYHSTAVEVYGHLSEVSDVTVNGGLYVMGGGRIDRISSGAFHAGSASALGVWRGAQVGTISGGTFDAGTGYGEALYNRGGTIGSISGGTFRGNANGSAIDCLGSIGRIEGTDQSPVVVTSSGGTGILVWSMTPQGEEPLVGSIGDISQVDISGASTGIYAYSLDGNDVPIDGIADSRIETSAYGIYLGEGAHVTNDIRRCVVTGGSMGLYNGGSVGALRDTTLRGTDYSGLGNSGHIAMIERCVLQGASYGAYNFSADGQTSAQIRTIGDENVFLGGDWGYYNFDEESPTVVEPNLEGSGRTSGTGRYWGGEGGIGGNVVYPAREEARSVRYHLAHTDDPSRADLVYRTDVDAFEKQHFSYLKLPYAISYRPNPDPLPNPDGTSNDYQLTGTMPDRVEEGDGRDVTVDPCGYSYEHHVFLGWNTEADGTGDWYPVGDADVHVVAADLDAVSSDDRETPGGIVLVDDVVLYAQWIYDDHAVTFHYQGGISDQGTGDDTSVLVDAHGRLAALPGATRAGYRFEGWFLDKDLTQRLDPDQVVAGDLDAYAGWTSTAPSEPRPTTEPAQETQPGPKTLPASQTKPSSRAASQLQASQAATPDTGDPAGTASTLGLVGGALAMLGVRLRRSGRRRS